MGDSVPHTRVPGLPGGPRVTAPHLGRPRPHLPHFLVLSQPLLRTLDFGTSCLHSRPRTCPPNLGVRSGKEGRLCVGRLARNSPHALLQDWRQKGTCRKSQGAGASSESSPPAEETPPQNEGPPQKGLLHKIGASGLVNSGHQEAEPAERPPRQPIFQGTPAPPPGRVPEAAARAATAWRAPRPLHGGLRAPRAWAANP